MKQGLIGDADLRRTLLLNRAQAHLSSERYDACLTDCHEVLKDSPEDTKALYRAAKAFYQLSQFKDAMHSSSKMTDQAKQDSTIAELITNIKHRIAEMDTGQYRWSSMINQGPKLDWSLDHATFTGPIEVRPAGDKGHGLFATREIHAGDLLLCEKAFAYSAAATEDQSPSEDVYLTINSSNKTMHIGTQPTMVSTTIERLIANPSQREQILSLTTNGYRSTVSATAGIAADSALDT